MSAPLAALAGGVRWGGVVALGLLLGAGGCAWRQVEVGPDPARMVVELNQNLDPSTAQVAGAQVGDSGINDCCHSWSGPDWYLDGWLVAPDQSLWSLPEAPDDGGRLRGFRVQGKVVLLAPPGNHLLRLRLKAQLTHSWRERVVYYRKRKHNGKEERYREYGWQDRSRYFSLVTFEKDIQLNLPPRGEVVLRPFVDDPVAGMEGKKP